MLHPAIPIATKGMMAVCGIATGFFMPLLLGLSALVLVTGLIARQKKHSQWLHVATFWNRVYVVCFFAALIPFLLFSGIFFFDFPLKTASQWVLTGHELHLFFIITLFFQTCSVLVIQNYAGKNTRSIPWFLLLVQLVSALLFVMPLLIYNAFINHPEGYHMAASGQVIMPDVIIILTSLSFLIKLVHVLSSALVVVSLLACGTGAWYLRKVRNSVFSMRNVVLGTVTGLLASLITAITGDVSVYTAEHDQPMKVAAMEGLFKGTTRAPLVVFGLINNSKTAFDSLPPFHVKIEIPGMLSKLATRNRNAFVPGIEDLLTETHPTPANQPGIKEKYPYVHVVFNAFHSMIIPGFFFIFLWLAVLIFIIRNTLSTKKWLLRTMIFAVPLGIFANEMGWVVSEAGRSPWMVQNLIMSKQFQFTQNMELLVFLLTVILFGVMAVFTIWYFAFVTGFRSTEDS